MITKKEMCAPKARIKGAVFCFGEFSTLSEGAHIVLSLIWDKMGTRWGQDRVMMQGDILYTLNKIKTIDLEKFVPGEGYNIDH